MAKIAAFHTSNVEDHKRSPVWHDNDECSEGKKIKLTNRQPGQKGSRCLICVGLDTRIKRREKFNNKFSAQIK